MDRKISQLSRLSHCHSPTSGQFKCHWLSKTAPHMPKHMWVHGGGQLRSQTRVLNFDTSRRNGTKHVYNAFLSLTLTPDFWEGTQQGFVLVQTKSMPLLPEIAWTWFQGTDPPLCICCVQGSERGSEWGRNTGRSLLNYYRRINAGLRWSPDDYELYYVWQWDLNIHLRKASSSSAARPDHTLQRWMEQRGVEEHHLIPCPESTGPTHHLYPVCGKQPFETHLLIAPNGIIKVMYVWDKSMQRDEPGNQRLPLKIRDSAFVIKILRNKVSKRMKKCILHKRLPPKRK